MIQPDVESIEIGESLIYVDRKTGKSFDAEVLESNALTGRVRIRYKITGPARKRRGDHGSVQVRISAVREHDTSVDRLFRVGGKRRAD